MKGLSLREPWCCAVLGRPGFPQKTVENRVWNTHLRGRFLLHAASQMTTREYGEAACFIQARGGVVVPPSGLQLGGFTGHALLVDVLPPRSHPYLAWASPEMTIFRAAHPLLVEDDLRWHMTDQYGYLLREITGSVFVPFKALQRFFNVPDDIAKVVLDGHS